MSLRITRINDLADTEAALLRQSPLVGLFYSDFLLDIWRQEFQWESLVVSTDSAALVAYVKKTSLGSILYSLPFGWYGGIIGENPAEADLAAIFDWLEKKAFLQENIVHLPAESSPDIVYPDRYQRRELSTHLLDLQANLDFSENVRRNIKRSVTRELNIVSCRRDALARFMALLREQVWRTQERRRLPEHFYSKLYLHGCNKASDVLSVGAEYDGQLCAIHLYFRNESDVFYFDGVTSEKGIELGANFLIFDSIISRLRAAGMKRLNLGATPSGDTGLKRFKSGWGARTFKYVEYSRRSILKQGIDFMVRR